MSAEDALAICRLLNINVGVVAAFAVGWRMPGLLWGEHRVVKMPAAWLALLSLYVPLTTLGFYFSYSLSNHPTWANPMFLVLNVGVIWTSLRWRVDRTHRHY